MHQRRHKVLRIEALVFGIELPSTIFQQMDELVISIQSLQIQGNAHAKRSGGAEIGVECQLIAHKAAPADRWCRRWSGRPSQASLFSRGRRISGMVSSVRRARW